MSLLSWIRRNSTALFLEASCLAGFLYSWHTSNKYMATLVSFYYMGTRSLYLYYNTRNTIEQNEAIVITGCDSGLGYSLAFHCQSLGAVVIVGVLDINGLGAKSLQENGIIVHPLDITDDSSITNFYNFLSILLSTKDLTLRALVNNAGVMVFGEFEWQTKNHMRHQLEVNLVGTMRITHTLMPLIRKDLSRIIVISSHCSSEPLPGVAVYSATKAGINAWATSIRVELKKYGIDIVIFVPGSFTHESNILSEQTDNFEAMKLVMSAETANFYGDYFNRYAKYFEPLSIKDGPKRINNPNIYEQFTGALLDRFPSTVYKCEPWRYFFYYTLFKITPNYVRDRLTEYFVQLPRWNEQKSIENRSKKREDISESI
ncbi:hypothetical protein M0802_006070 [Mischocyttarus mexicanus]|nr:hypothetical protein M0802_006070 [Mischocyttarus mexicanus]